MKRTGILIAAAMLLLPSAALAAPGMVTTSVGLRAGPGDGFPVVDRIPGGSHVNIHGCLKGDAWCDVSWSDDRGWVSSDELQWLYRNNYVYLSDYYDDIDVPVVPFVIGSYWSSYCCRPAVLPSPRLVSIATGIRMKALAMRTPDRIAPGACRSMPMPLSSKDVGAAPRRAPRSTRGTALTCVGALMCVAARTCAAPSVVA